MTTKVDVREYATAVARYGLPGAEAPPALDDDAWSLALATLGEEKIIGIAMAAADAGWLPVKDQQYQQLVDRHRTAMVWCLALERRLLEMSETFDSEGIDFIVLKGPALAHTVYPDPSWRTFNDLDLLVRTSQWEGACRVLAEVFGWRRRLPEPRPGFDVRFGKAAVFTTESGQQIDLHRNLAQGPFGIRITPEGLVRSASRFTIADGSFGRLNNTGLFLHACIHAVLGDAKPNAQQLRDISATALSEDLDGTLLRDWTRAWRLTGVVARAVSMATAWQKDALPPRSALLRFEYPSRTERRLLDAHIGSRRQRLPLATVRTIPGLRPRMAYIAARIFPSEAFLRARTSRSGMGARVSRIVAYAFSLRNSRSDALRAGVTLDSAQRRGTQVRR